MPDTTIQAAQTIWEGAKWLLVFLASLVGWNLRRLITKVDTLEKENISRDEFNDTVRTIRRENREDFKSIHEKLDRMK